MERGVVGRQFQVTIAKFGVWPLLVLRALALCATSSAALVMILNKQTKTFVVAVDGNTPITATVTTKFQYMPAFVFFVAANAIASLHNLGMLLFVFFGDKYYTKGFGLLTVAISDMGMVGLVSSGAAAGAAVGQIAEHGNSHAQWNKNCNIFDTFCKYNNYASIASITGAGLLMGLNMLSTIRLYRNQAPS